MHDDTYSPFCSFVAKCSVMGETGFSDEFSGSEIPLRHPAGPKQAEVLLAEVPGAGDGVGRHPAGVRRQQLTREEGLCTSPPPWRSNRSRAHMRPASRGASQRRRLLPRL
jgi:hypothetical protein